MPSFGSKNYTYKLVGEQRKSKIVGDAGCGALVEFPGFSGIMGGQNLWFDLKYANDMKIHEKSLEEKLDKEYFVQVVTDKNSSNKNKNAYRIPVIRFPEYYYCPKCHQLDFAKNIAINYKSDKSHTEPLKCNHCSDVELLPSRFVIACADGHLEDFPYLWWVHKGEECKKPKLELEYKGKTGGLESIIVSCKTCGKSQSMANVLNKGATVMLNCHGRSPWLDNGNHKHKCDCGKPVVALMRGSSNIYYPEQESALTIPPWSNIVQKYIDEVFETLKAYFVPVFNHEMKIMALKSHYQTNRLNDSLHCSEDEFIEQVFMRFTPAGVTTNAKKKSDIQLDEYLAFTGVDKDDYFFKTKEEEIDNDLKPYLAKVKLVKRLREVKVLKSFRRISAFEDEGSKSAPLSDKRENWLPAAELLGEGIFIEFSKEKLKNWVEKVGNRYDSMRARFNKANLGATHNCSFSPILVALHTFSHLLMRELSYNCGYDSAALCERLYVSDGSEKEWMAGILIYTASTCSDGSLGGLVRQGEKKRLKNTIISTLSRASWCSNDPICIEATAQGLNSLNYAACHACTLVPEISCCFNNTVLDRLSIVGILDDRSLGLFGDLI